MLAAMIEQFPFVIRGFHSDDGSEFINHAVARLLNKLLVEQTKSRPHHSNDNGLAEAKNGAVVRKHTGHWHIAAEHAEAIERFYESSFNLYPSALANRCAIPTFPQPPLRLLPSNQKKGEPQLPQATELFRFRLILR